jgi:hypothetical protein
MADYCFRDLFDGQGNKRQNQELFEETGAPVGVPDPCDLHLFLIIHPPDG